MYNICFPRGFHFKKNSHSQFTHRLSSYLFSAESIKQSSLKKIQVLLVDDHRMMREGLRRMLDEHDDIVIIGEAADGKEAVELAREICPDIILMDVNMPVMNGIEATRRIINDTPKMRIIGLSMNSKNRIREDMKSAGASAYLRKSEAFDLLIETIRSEASA